MRPIVGRAAGLTPVHFGLPMGDQALLQGTNADAAARRNCHRTKPTNASSTPFTLTARGVRPGIREGRTMQVRGVLGAGSARIRARTRPACAVRALAILRYRTWAHRSPRRRRPAESARPGVRAGNGGG